MKANNATGLRRILEGLPTDELDQLLQEELQKKPQDEAAVKMILTILEERDAAAPKELPQQVEAARERYHEKMRELFRPESKRSWTPVLKVASIVLVACILLVGLPLRAEAETFWEMLQLWSDTVLGYFGREDEFGELNNTFETDHPGMQQVYDTAVEMSIEYPMMPEWLPEEAFLTELKSEAMPMADGLTATFSYAEGEIVYMLTCYTDEPAHRYYRDDSHYENYELEGITFNITRNNDRWSVIWTKDNIECHITLDCREDTLRRILKSIYVMEE